MRAWTVSANPTGILAIFTFNLLSTLSNLNPNLIDKIEERKMEWWVDRNEVEKHPFYSKTPESRTTMRNNGIKTSWKLKSQGKIESLAGNEDNMDHGHHHG